MCLNIHFYWWEVFLFCYVICSYRNTCFPELFVPKDELLGDLIVLLTENLQATTQLELPLPFSAKAKNGWSYAAISSICIQGVHKHNGTFTLTMPLKIQCNE